MRFSLMVHDGPWHSRRTLHMYQIAGPGIWLPKGSWVQIPITKLSDDDDGSINGYVDRALFDMHTNEVSIQLEPYRIDPPEGQEPSSHERLWWSRDGDLRALLDGGGWTRYA